MQHCFRHILAQAPVLACFYSRFQEFVQHHFICFYVTIACSAPFTMRVWHFCSSTWLHLFIFFKVGHVKHECMASTHPERLVHLSSAAWHLVPLLFMMLGHHIPWVPAAHPALLQREMEGKGPAIYGNIEEPRTRNSISPHPRLLRGTTSPVSHLTATVGPKHFSWQARYQMMELLTIYLLSSPLPKKNSLLSSFNQAAVWLMHILKPSLQSWLATHEKRMYVINSVRQFISWSHKMPKKQQHKTWKLRNMLLQRMFRTSKHTHLLDLKDQQQNYKPEHWTTWLTNN